MALHIESDPASVGVARRWVARRAVDVGASPDAVEDATLGTSELVTNAVKYGPENGAITVEAEAEVEADAEGMDEGKDEGLFGVSVSDDSHEPPVSLPEGARAVGGRGVRLVQSFATHWDVVLHEGDGKTVSFAVPLASRDSGRTQSRRSPVAPTPAPSAARRPPKAARAV